MILSYVVLPDCPEPKIEYSYTAVVCAVVARRLISAGSTVIADTSSDAAGMRCSDELPKLSSHASLEDIPADPGSCTAKTKTNKRCAKRPSQDATRLRRASTYSILAMDTLQGRGSLTYV